MNRANHLLRPATLEVVRLFAECQNPKEIAAARRCTVKNVEYHLHQALLRLELPSRLHLVHWAREFGVAGAVIHRVEHDVPIPSRKAACSPIRAALRQLAQVGDSLVLRYSSCAIYKEAARLGLRVMIRRDGLKTKAPRYRVWRTDGKTAAQVNDLLAKRRPPKPLNSP